MISPARSIGAVGQRIVDNATRSSGESWRIDLLRLYLNDDGTAWLQVRTDRDKHEAIRSLVDDDDLLGQLRAIMTAVREREAV